MTTTEAVANQFSHEKEIIVEIMGSIINIFLVSKYISLKKEEFWYIKI